jgi:hypothetical protein
MNKQELEHKLEELQQEFELKKKELMRQFCDANNLYKVGDKFTDHIGTIIIEKIRYLFTVKGTPSCVYFGTELKKDGTPKKNNEKRNAWQLNDVRSLF